MGMGTAAALFAVFCCRDFAEIAAERKNGCRVGHIFAVPIFGTSKPEKTSVLFCVIFLGRQKLEQIRRARAHLSIVELHFRSILARVGSHLHPI